MAISSKNKARLIVYGTVAIGIIVYTIIGVSSAIKSRIIAKNSAVPNTLRFFHGVSATFRKKGYSGQGIVYPVGNDPSIENNGKYAGLYYEGNSARAFVTLIGNADANADLRADDSTDIDYGTGTYLSCAKFGGVSINDSYLEETEHRFKLSPKDGYWFGLMMYYNDGKEKHAYDTNYSRNHFAFVAVPAEYGNTGKKTFIMNEDGNIYWKDLGKSEYIDTYPGPDPTKHGWVLWKSDNE